MLLLILAANCFSVTSEGVSYCFPPRLTPLLFSLKKKGWHRRAKQRATHELSSQVFKPVRPMSVLISPIVPFQPSWGGVPFLPFFMTCFGDHACYSVHRHSSPFLFCLLYYFVQECLGWRKWQNYVSSLRDDLEGLVVILKRQVFQRWVFPAFVVISIN